MKNRVLTPLLLGVALGILASSTVRAAPLGSAFSYQGRLLESGAPANGGYDLRFELFATETGGSSYATTLTNAAVIVSNGVFTATLDFGTNVFTGASCWLEISVRLAGLSDPFVTLSPRQLLTPTPFAIYTLKAETLNGPLPDAQLPASVARLNANQTFTGTVTFQGQVRVASLDVQGSVRGASFSGNGAGLSNVVASDLSARVVQRLWRVPIPFVSVTNAGNAPDFNGKGAVPYDFRIGKYEVNNNQYAAFLNAVAAEDAHSLYSSNMTSDLHGGIIRSGCPGEYSYAVKPGMGHQPVVWVDFHDALRFCNWLHNGQPVGVQDNWTTEDGAYTMTAEGVSGNSITRNSQARYWLPGDNEWYKAAYHQPYAADGDPSDYWRYPTRSNDPPFSEPPPGGGNSANSCCGFDTGATDVGAYVYSPSYYGTFDQGGNAQEWAEEVLYVSNRRLRGGSWAYNIYYTQSTDLEFDTPDYDSEAIGFRVAGAAGP